MSFSQGAAMNIVPLLSRLVLAAAFIPAGWGKIMGEDVVFEGKDAQILRDRGIGTDVEPAEESSRASGVVLASYRLQVETGTLGERKQPAENQDEQEPPKEEAPAATMPVQPTLAPAEEPPIEPSPPGEPTTEEPQVVPIHAKPVHRITVMLVGSGWDWNPGLMAWLGAATELIGGALILIGLFSRLWGLGLAVVMGFAFYLTSWGALCEGSLFSLPIPQFNAMFAQLGLFVLAFGVFLTGAGGLSLDRIIFRRGGSDFEEEHVLVDIP